MGVPYAEVIGDPIAHSKSPIIHKFWLETLRLAGDYRATRVTSDELPSYLATRRVDRDWRGCSVTMPHKDAVVPLLDTVDSFLIGAINCIVPRDGGLHGFNTDGAGVDEAIVNWSFGNDDSRICLIGAGGAARAAIAELDVFCYFNFDLVVRDESKGRAFLERCNVAGEVYSFADAAAAMVGRDAAINASPLGMTGFPPMPESVLEALVLVGRERALWYRPRGFALEMVTAPVRTLFVERAETAGLEVSDGLTMLIGQARLAFRHFFGTPPPEADQALRRRLES
jgi:shikimate dehydrogenase